MPSNGSEPVKRAAPRGRTLAILAGAALTVATACGEGSEPVRDPDDLHQELFLMDMHVDSMLFTTLYGTDFGAPHEPPSGLEYLYRPQADLPGLVAGGVDALWFGIVVFPLCQPAHCLADALSTVATTHRVIAEHADRLELALGADDVERIRRAGRMPALIGLEGAHGVGDDPEDVDRLWAAGVRYVGMAHFTPNPFAGTNLLDVLPNAGLTDKGRRLVERMNELGMMIDLAHTHPASIRDVLAASRAPCIVSHTGLRGVFDIFRNLSDEDLVAIAERGGVVGVFFASLWLAPDNTSTVSDVADHIEHVVRVAGIDHVAVGSDFDGLVKLPDDLPDADAFPALTRELVRRGYGRRELRKIYGENALRVMRDVEQVAADLAGDGLSRPLPPLVVP